MTSGVRLQWLVVAAALLLPLAFAAYTQHAWEDYFITLRASRNLVEGHGLVFNPGERVHTFTSPLGTLLPALCTALAGPDREELALWLFRFINAGLLASGAALLWRRAETLRLGAVGKFTLFGLLLADAKLTDFAINGMETAILVFFLIFLWSELESPQLPRVRSIALALAGLMWTRPDAFVLAGTVMASHLAIRQRVDAPARAHWPQLWRGALLGGLCYLPWFAWAWWYYGTPVPHTIVAKATFTPAIELKALLLLPLQTLAGQSMLLDLFMPSYWTFGSWPEPLKYFSHALALLAAFAWIFPQLPAAGRRASFAVFVGMFYVCSIILFPWYVPPWTALAAIAIAFAIDQLASAARAANRRLVLGLARTLALAFVLVQIALLLGVAWQMRAQQTFVETGVRRAIGEWLRQNASPKDTVFLEPLGYIGYFSKLKTHDFPGLSSPEVVATIRSGGRKYADIIARLQPTWLVLRPREANRPEFTTTPVLRDYEVVKIWDAVPQLDRIRFLPGRTWMEAEAQYLLFRRKT